jgi:hypothetical protein
LEETKEREGIMQEDTKERERGREVCRGEGGGVDMVQR